MVIRGCQVWLRRWLHRPLHGLRRRSWLRNNVLRSAVLSCFVLISLQTMTAQPVSASMNRFCQLSEAEAQTKESLRVAGLQGDEVSQREYKRISRQQSEAMHSCRRSQWPQNQAVWLRLYPCDLRPGGLDALMDRIVNLGYNQVYIESFSNGQVLLPKNDNPTVWPSVVQFDEFADRDLLAEAIASAHEHSLDAYAWMFTLNFGYSYGQRSDRRQVLARNGTGSDTVDFADNGKSGVSEEAFIDPYNRVAQQDYQQMLRAVLARKPDGALYDYVRYPRLVGGGSVVSQVRDLWIYGPAASQALVQRGTNGKGRSLIQSFLRQGYLTESVVAQMDSIYPDEGEPLWQSRTPIPVAPDDLAPAAERRPGLQSELWRLSVAHAIQGVVDFLQAGAATARQEGLPTGAVFFPNGNRAIGNGYDSRLQHWNRFPAWMDFYPMAYAVCGNTNCIVDEVRRVANVRRNLATVKPALAGIWGVTQENRPSLEAQMDAMQRAFPQIKTVSHFAFSWQDAEFDRVRKFCPTVTRRVSNRETLLGASE